MTLFTCPFTVVIDTNEGAPFTFQNLNTRAKHPKSPLIVTFDQDEDTYPVYVDTVDRALWNQGGADYTIDGLEKEIQIETKHSVHDLFASCGRRRKNFEAEIAGLNRTVKYSLVLVTATWRQIIDGVEQSEMHPNSVINTIIGWQMRYPFVHWIIVPTRELAELTCFQTLEMMHRKYSSDASKSKNSS